MGSAAPTTTNYNSSSDETEDSEYYSLDSDMEDNVDYFMTSDAVYTEKSVRFSKHLSSHDIPIIESGLDKNEKVSLIYLLYDIPYTALQKIFMLLRNKNINILDDWYHYEKKHNTKWQSKLLEALTIIQNYKILRELGFKKEEMKITYQPEHYVSLHINLIRKYCYRVCEDFDIKTTKHFLQSIEKDFIARKKDYLPKHDEMLYDEQYLEMFFLYLETEGYMSVDELQNLAKIFKQMALYNLYDEFQNLHDKLTNKRIVIDKTPGLQTSEPISNEKVLIKNNNAGESDIYEIDPENPGLLLIINNMYFHTEYRDNFIELLPKTELKLESRHGSESDEKKLTETFSRRGFAIMTKQNKIHDEMLEIIKDVVKDFKYSSLIVAILSHGDQGVVYGANSIAVPVSKIQDVICQKQLSGKPKILLLQSCQGSDCQKVDDDNLEVDGPSKKYVPPKTTDLLTFRATIPGYGAVRHKVQGSWFIQVLCKAVEQNPEHHMQDICSKVIAEVSAKQWGDKCMVPLIESTFTKRLYYNVTK